MKRMIYLLALSVTIILNANAQENFEYKVSITKNGQKVMDTTFSSENETGLAKVLFNAGAKSMSKNMNKNFEWNNGDVLKVVALEEGKQVKMLKVTEGGNDSLVQEILIKEVPEKIIYKENIGGNQQTGSLEGAQKKIIWVTEETEENNEGTKTKKIIIKTAEEGEELENIMFFNTETEGNVIIELNGENVNVVEKEVIVNKVKSGKGEYNFEMRLNNGQISIAMVSMSNDEASACKLASNQNFNPSELTLKSGKEELQYVLSFETKEKAILELLLLDESGNEIQNETMKKANEFDCQLNFPQKGKYTLLLMQKDQSRLYKIKVE